MIEKERALKLVILAVAVWLFIGVAVLLIPNPSFEQCDRLCEGAGFDVVLSASPDYCRCYNTVAREERVIANA